MSLRAEETAERRAAHVTGARRALAVGLAGLAVLAGCDPWVVGDGVFAESLRTVPAFAGVQVEDGVEVDVAAGAVEQAVRVSGDENVLQYLKTSVVQDPSLGPTLVVKTTVRHIESTHPLRVTIDATAFDHLQADSGSQVDVENASADTFTVRASDGANVELAGKGGAHLAVSLSGSAQLDALSYVAQDAEVTLDDGAAAHLHVDGPITGTIASGALLENAGEGPCQVTVTGAATVECGP